MPWRGDVRPEERRPVVAAFLTLTGILAAHIVLETARDALFLARLPASQLPWVYLVMALASVGLAQLPGRWLRRAAGGRALSLLLLASALVTLAFWRPAARPGPWLLRTLYIWTGVMSTLATVQFWLVLGESYTISQAKRLYRIVGAGGLAGAVAGAALARAVSLHADVHHLVLTAALLMAATGAGPALLLRRGGSRAAGAEGRWTPAQAREILQRQPYVTRLASLMLVSTMALTLGDYVFKSTVAARVPAAELGAFFATFYMVLNVLALLAQVFLTGWLLRAVGLHQALWALPALVFAGSIGVAFGGGLAAALLLKGADGTLRTSLHRTGTELLFLPIPDALRHRVKPVIDVVGQRGGQAIASVLILSQLSLYGDIALAGAAAVLCTVWVTLASELRPHYVQMFRAALREGFIERSADVPELDMASLEALFAALNSQDDAEVTAALELLAGEGRVRLVPALVLYHPSPAVVVRALELFTASGRTDFLPITERLLQAPEPALRAAALRARLAARPDDPAGPPALGDASPEVRAVAVVELTAAGLGDAAVQAARDGLLADASAGTRRALAQAIQQRPSSAFEPLLIDLAGSLEPEARIAATAAMGALRSEAFLPVLVSLLADHQSRNAARAALAAFGPAGLRHLDQALDDPRLGHAVRRQIPRTISRFAPAEAAPLLLRRLLAERDGRVRFRILRGLGRLAAERPELPLDAAVLAGATERTLEEAFRLAHWRLLLQQGVRAVPERATRGYELLAMVVRDKQAYALERIFRLLGLQHRREDFERIYDGFRSPDPKVRASSRELIESLIRPPMRAALLALVEDVPAADRLQAGAPYYRPQELRYEGLLLRLLEDPSETLRCMAAYHVGELKLRELREAIEAMRGRETGVFVGKILARTLSVLAAPPRDGLAHAG